MILVVRLGQLTDKATQELHYTFYDRILMNWLKCIVRSVETEIKGLVQITCFYHSEILEKWKIGA
jgi:hypothetical protein